MMVGLQDAQKTQFIERVKRVQSILSLYIYIYIYIDTHTHTHTHTNTPFTSST
jgi:hypothetical protein